MRTALAFGLEKIFFGKNNAKSCFVSEMFIFPEIVRDVYKCKI